MADTKAVHISRLIAVPTVITLAVTILRLAGELKHWPTPWFSTVAGGGGAIVGIAWLPILFGPYFAVKLAAAGQLPTSFGKAIGFAFLGLILYFIAGVLIQPTFRRIPVLTLGVFLLTLVAGLVPLAGWGSLGRVLIAYALAARIPVLVVMYLAMSGNEGAGWGTHYDAVLPALAKLTFARKYVYAAVVPQMTLWIGWTVILGAIFGGVVGGIVYGGKQAAPASAYRP